uniref:Uncharacterized protein n=1 Tax=Zea mays TaxID=4577 RepID=A0A804MGE2_MAIZE
MLALDGAAAPLVRLRALERRDERVGQGRRVVAVVVAAEQRRRCRRGEAVERHVEAQLQRLALQRVGV